MNAKPLSDQLRALSDTTADGHETELLVNSAELLDEMSEALRQVEAWWLSDGLTRFDGAPHCIFRVRELASKSGTAPTRTAPDALEVAVTREGRVLVGHSNCGEFGGFDLIGDITEQLQRMSILAPDEAMAPLKLLVGAVGVLTDGPDDSDLTMAADMIGRGYRLGKSALVKAGAAQ